MEGKHPNPITARLIQEAFPTPVPDQLAMVIDKCRSGYILAESRPFYRDPSIKTRRPFARFVFKDGEWEASWQRASGKWMPLAKFVDLGLAIDFVKSNPNGCFLG